MGSCKYLAPNFLGENQSWGLFNYGKVLAAAAVNFAETAKSTRANLRSFQKLKFKSIKATKRLIKEISRLHRRYIVIFNGTLILHQKDS